MRGGGERPFFRVPPPSPREKFRHAPGTLTKSSISGRKMARSPMIQNVVSLRAPRMTTSANCLHSDVFEYVLLHHINKEYNNNNISHHCRFAIIPTHSFLENILSLGILQ